MTTGNNRVLPWLEDAGRMFALRQTEYLPLQGGLRHATLVAGSGAHH
ncbi:MAG: hypothetical protein P4M07_06095 [Xanthobacteraceae bacterium]|nr:hypothetical protein [Xanthobacteraceae bacterium]